MMVFIDVNMPQLEVRRSRRELLVSISTTVVGTHTKVNVDFREVVELLFLCAMGPGWWP